MDCKECKYCHEDSCDTFKNENYNISNRRYKEQTPAPSGESSHSVHLFNGIRKNTTESTCNCRSREEKSRTIASFVTSVPQRNISWSVVEPKRGTVCNAREKTGLSNPQEESSSDESSIALDKTHQPEKLVEFYSLERTS